MNCCFRCLRRFFQFKRKLEGLIYLEEVHVKSDIQHTELPWLWIGAELYDSRIVSLTETINNCLCRGDIVDEEFLKKHTKISYVKRWLYLDSQTLKEDEIPPEGLIIKNDTN